MSTTLLPRLAADAVLDLLPVAVYVCSAPEGRILHFNKRAVDLWGRRPTEQDRYCGSLQMLRDDGTVLPHEACPMAEVVRGGPPVEGRDVRVRRPDGAERVVSVFISPLRDESGTLSGAVNAFHDVTAHRRAEAALREAQIELRDFVDNAAEGLHWVGADGTILWANRAELEMMGYAAQEYVGHHISEFHADAAVIDDILARLTRDETLRDCEAVMRCKDGSTRHVLINSNVYRREGQFVHTRCFTRDITERKRAERELARAVERETAARAQAEAALRLKDDFLAALSHELRTPLNAILGRTHMLLSGAVPAERQREVLATIRRNADAQHQIVEDMLDLSSFIAGRVQLACDTLTINEPVAAALEVVEPAATAKRISIEADVPALAVRADRGRLQQVFWNLLANGVKFTPPGGRITVTGERRDGRIRAVVRDTGIGITPDFLPFVFDRFAQATQSRFHGGLGLGLAIVRQIVEAHGGTVSAHSDGLHRGAEFVVELPAV